MSEGTAREIDLEALAAELRAAGWEETWRTVDQEGKPYLHCHGWAIWENGAVTAPMVVLPHDFQIAAIIGRFVTAPGDPS